MDDKIIYKSTTQLIGWPLALVLLMPVVVLYLPYKEPLLLISSGAFVGYDDVFYPILLIVLYGAIWIQTKVYFMSKIWISTEGIVARGGLSGCLQTIDFQSISAVSAHYLGPRTGTELVILCTDGNELKLSVYYTNDNFKKVLELLKYQNIKVFNDIEEARKFCHKPLVATSGCKCVPRNKHINYLVAFFPLIIASILLFGLAINKLTEQQVVVSAVVQDKYIEHSKGGKVSYYAVTVSAKDRIEMLKVDENTYQMATTGKPVTVKYTRGITGICDNLDIK